MPITEAERRRRTSSFVAKWNTDERLTEFQHTQAFWTDLIKDLFCVDNPHNVIEFEKPTSDGGRIDAFFPDSYVLIEQKARGVNLASKRSQRGTPYEQAKSYIPNLPHSEHPLYVITCNFDEIYVYDMTQTKPVPEVIRLADLETDWYRLSFLVNTQSAHIKKEVQLSETAGDIIRKLYAALLAQYQNPNDSITKDWLNKLCVRLVFCMYAEHSGIFPERHMFQDFLKEYKAEEIHEQLAKIFTILNTKEEERKSNTRQSLMRFPYVNGGLFEDEADAFAEQIPIFSEECKQILLNEACAFNWSDISPTIFGAMFESTLREGARKHGGMHYTSIENIHKVIDPLFLDDLKAELEHIKSLVKVSEKRKQLIAFKTKIASLKFLDPACGSGNFLTLTYMELRKLENEALFALQDEGQLAFQATGEHTPILVSIENFYGIEINDFAVKVARTALWIAEHQMWLETKKRFADVDDIIPLIALPNIVCANALRIDWDDVVPSSQLSYIISNPPFVGSSVMKQNSPQKLDVQSVFHMLKNSEVQDLDYVSAWYKVAADYIHGTNIEVCFVSTNSICQGSQVAILWGLLLNNSNIHINFAYKTFRWDSESTTKAAVHCVILCFSEIERKKKKLFDNDCYRDVDAISPYLIPEKTVLVPTRKKPLCDVPKTCSGNQPRDGQFFQMTTEEKNVVLKKEPNLEKWIRPYIGAEEYIKRKQRWCFWLRDATPNDIESSKILSNVVDSVRQFRLNSTAPTTNGYAKTPHLFAQMTQPRDCGSGLLLIPNTSSENRYYIPIGFAKPDVITSNAVSIATNATLFHFGVLISNVHMIWMRGICGRLESRYRYSCEIVYNNFPWCTPTKAQKQRIEQTAQMILDARALYPDSSFAVLYKTGRMPKELQKAHEANDRAVMAAYGFRRGMTEEQIVIELLKRYAELTANE